MPAIATTKSRDNRLTSVNGTTATYDDAGRLTAVGSLASFVYDPLDAVKESTGGNVRQVHLYSATDERIASVTIGANGAPASWEYTGKLQQVLNLINDKTLNPAGKQVVVYAPNLGKHATKTLQDAGAIVVRTTDELRKVAQ